MECKKTNLVAPIAIIGMSCRFPQAGTLQEFWGLLRDGKNTITPIPAERWNIADYYSPDAAAENKTCQQHASMLKDIHDFDPLFFEISPAEAVEMSPSQKLLLELVWEVIENAAIPFKKVQGTGTGVYVGNTWNDFEHFRKQRNAPVTSHSALGRAANIIANRVSFVYGFTGPSMVVDTGCSSSLVALHLACQSLRDNSIEMAVVGGVNHILDPDLYILLSKFGGLSPKGSCNTFDLEADGFVRGEGGAILLLKRLSAAEKDGNKILAVIRGTAINNNGYNINLPATSITGQLQLLTRTYEQSGIFPHEVHYIEAHGTGTRVGDPAEAKALGTFFGNGRDDALPVGSVKTNIGHLEGAAGIAGLLKVVLALQYKMLPPSLNYKTPNPEIPFEKLQLCVQTALTPWPVHNEVTRKAGVNSFGWGGTNAHAVVEEYISPAGPQVVMLPEIQWYCLPVSAKSVPALRAYVRGYLQCLETATGSIFQQVCTAAALLKPAFNYRVVFAAGEKHEMIRAMQHFLREESAVSQSYPLLTAKDKIVMVFSGQGSQWLGMGQELYLKEPVFRQAIDACDQAFRPYTKWSLPDQLYACPEDSRLDEIDVVQPLLCAIQIALAKLWMLWGIVPHAVVGHSMGEVAAAYIAGAITLSDAACIICTRSRLMNSVSGEGSTMAVTELSLAHAEAYLQQFPELSIAASNSPGSTVLAGPGISIHKVMEELEARQLFCRLVNVPVASHSRQMDTLTQTLRETLQDIRPLASTIPFFSTVHCKIIPGEQLDSRYWAANLRKTVRFSGAMAQLMREGHTIYIEISPHPVLTNAVNECAAHYKTRIITIPSLYRGKPELAAVYSNLGELYTQGFAINWEQVYRTAKAPDVQLPSYPFQRERYELASDMREMEHQRKESAPSFKEWLDKCCADEEIRTALEQLIIKSTARIVKMPSSQIHPAMTFKELGIDSIMAGQLTTLLEKDLEIKLPVTMCWSYPVIREYALQLGNIIRMDPSAPKRDVHFCLFCFHDAGGSSTLFYGWEALLGATVELITVDLPGRGRKWAEKPCTNMNGLIDAIIQQELTPLPDKPYFFFGHSMGGLLAFEIARALRKAGRTLPGRLFISGLPAPAIYSGSEIDHMVNEQELIKQYPYLDKATIGNDALQQQLLRIMRSDLQLINSYIYQHEAQLHIPTTVIYGNRDPFIEQEHIEAWAKEISLPLKVIIRPGAHRYIEHDREFLTSFIMQETDQGLL